MKTPRLNALDWIIVAVFLGAVIVVVYRYKTEGSFHFGNLFVMLLLVSGYARYRGGRSNASRGDGGSTRDVGGEKH